MRHCSVHVASPLFGGMGTPYNPGQTFECTKTGCLAKVKALENNWSSWPSIRKFAVEGGASFSETDLPCLNLGG